MDELVTLSRSDLFYYGLVSGLFALIWYDLENIFVVKVLPWLKDKKKRRKEKRYKNKPH